MEETETTPTTASRRVRQSTALSFLCGRTGLLVLTIGYALLGAVLFKAIEGGVETSVPHRVQRSREDCLKELWLITERLNVLYEKNWTKLVTEQLKRFERSVIESGKLDGSNSPMTSSSTADRWSFGGALLYSLTLLTTIGYGRLSPRTALGKVVAMLYALIGVPLMLVLLSTLGSLLAGGVRRGYLKLCCKRNNAATQRTVIGYHKAPSSPSARYACRGSHDDTIQITTHNNSSMSASYKIVHTHLDHHVDHQEPPKRALLATVRASHARGRCRQGQVRQLLADAHLCPQHSQHASRPCGPMSASDVDDAEDTEESEHGLCAHDTPSRVPLIWRPPEVLAQLANPTEESSMLSSATSSSSSPSVPAILVLVVFVCYVGIGAVSFATTIGWNVLDAVYFCFIALSTIGVGDKLLPHGADLNAQLQLFACCLYIFVGLVVVAMCFTLVHEEVANKCRQLAIGLGLTRN